MVTNYDSGVSSFSVLNATDGLFAANAFLLLGNIGSEDAEVVKIASLVAATGVITITTPTVFAHSESTRVTILPYNQIRFFHTATTTFGTATPLTGYVNIQASDWFTSYNDESNSTGYGWYTFYNSQTALLSQQSNYIPYTGFSQSTTENLLEDFFSLLSNKELRLVSRDDALSWASEGYSKIRDKLNVVNMEYTASDLTPLNVLATVIEYTLPDDFDQLVSITSGLDQTSPGKGINLGKQSIQFISLSNAYAYTGSELRYYIRGEKIGILPTPTESATFNYIYLKKATRLSSNTDTIDLPNNGVLAIKDWMMGRAMMKFQNQLQADRYFKMFTDAINNLIISAVKRDANLDTWGISPEANV